MYIVWGNKIFIVNLSGLCFVSPGPTATRTLPSCLMRMLLLSRSLIDSFLEIFSRVYISHHRFIITY